MDKSEAIEKLTSIQRYGCDIEADHAEADDVLCELLISLGHEDVVMEYHKIDKWYA